MGFNVDCFTKANLKGGENLNFHKGIIDNLFKSIGQAVGVHVFVVILERALWQTQLKYEEAAMIKISEHGVSIQEEMFVIDQDRADLLSHEFLINIINTMGNLVGKELVIKLTDELDKLKIEELELELERER